MSCGLCDQSRQQEEDDCVILGENGAGDDGGDEGGDGGGAGGGGDDGGDEGGDGGDGDLIDGNIGDESDVGDSNGILVVAKGSLNVLSTKIVFVHFFTVSLIRCF